MNSSRGQICRVAACCLAGMLAFFHACQPRRAASSPEEAIREGWRLYRLSEFNSAVKIFQSVQASQPRGSEYRLHALYGEASCWNHRRDGRDIARAVAGYQAVVEEAPENGLASWCALDIVRTRHLAPADQPIDYQSLIRDYATVYRRYPDSPAGEEAFLYYGTLSLHSANSERVGELRREFTEFLSSHPKTPYLSQLYEMIADCYRKTDDQESRVQYMIKALEARPVDSTSPSDDRSNAYWNIAYAAEFEAGNFAVARQFYRRLIDEFPQDIRVFGIRKALERMDATEAALREGREPQQDQVEGARRMSHLEEKK